MDRFIPFKGIINSRDLGGLKNNEGRTVRKGLLLRTANLSQATDSDLARLSDEYRLSMVIDLRTKSEQKSKPDRLPEKVIYLPLPVFDEAAAGITHEEERPSPFTLPDMAWLYRVMVTEKSCRSALHTALTAIFTHDYDHGAVLWHCAGGKDRCGIVSSLVLAALGVDRRDIMEDYAINPEEFIAEADAIYRSALRSGRPEPEASAARDVFLALPRYMESAFQAIDEHYAGSDAFLTDGLKIPEAVIAEFRSRMLV